MSWPRASARNAVIALAAFAALAGLLGVLIATGPVRRWTLARLTQTLAAQGVGLRASDLHYSLFGLSASFEAPELRAPPGDAAPFLKARRIDVRLAWRSRGLIVTVISPELLLATGPDGRTNLPELPAASGGADGPVALERVVMRDGRLEWRDERSGASATAPVWQLEVDRRSGGGYRLRFATGAPVAVRYAGRDYSLQHLDAAGDASATALDLSGHVRSDLGAAAFHATGSPSQPRVAGDVSFQRVRIDGAGDVDGSSRFVWSAQSERVMLTDLHVRSGGAAIDGTLNLALSDTAGRSVVTARFAQVASERFVQQLPVSSVASGRISASWPGLVGWRKATGEAAVELAAPLSTKLIPVSGSVQLSGGVASVRAKIAKLSARGAEASGEVTLRGEALAGQLAIAIPDIAATLPGAPHGPVSIEASLAGTARIPVAEVHVRSTLARLEIEAHGAVQEASLQLAGRFAGRAPAPAEGALSGTFEIAGPPRLPEATARVSVAGLAAGGEALGNAEAALTYKEDLLTVTSFRVVKRDGSIEGSGTGDLAKRRYQFTAAVKKFPIDKLFKAVLDGTAVFGHTATGATGEAKLAASGVVMEGRTIGAAQLVATLAGESVQFQVAAPGLGISAAGHSAIAAPYAAAAEATLRDFPLETSGYEGVAGTASGTIAIRGELADLAKLRAEANLSALTVRSGGEELQSSGPVKASYANGTVEIETATLVSGDSKATLSGRVPGAVRVDADLNAALLARLVKLDPAWPVAGRLRANVTATGSGKDWQPEGTAELVDGSAGPVTGAQASLEFGNGVARIVRAEAAWLGGQLRATGEIPIAGNASFRLQAELAGLELERYGRATLHAEVQGPSLDPRRITARITAPELRLRIGELDFTPVAEPAITVRNGLLRIDSFSLAGPGAKLQARGEAGLTAPYPLALRIDGDLDAALASLFTDAVTAQGRADVHVAVTGTTQQPRIGGSIEFAGLQAAIPAAGAAIENLAARIDMDGRTITLSRLAGSLNGGTLTGEGSARIDNGALADVALRVKSANSAWNIPAGFETAANIDLVIAGSAKQLTAGGEISILEGSYREQMVIERGLFRALQNSSTPATSSSAAWPIALNVRVRTVAPLLVANDLLNGAIRADLRFTGTPSRPGLVGRADLEEGANLYLGGRNYLVERGAVTFTDERRIEPVLDVLARTRAGGYRINLEARGPVGKNLETSFTADPTLPEPDILALLATGRTLKEARGSEIDIAGDQALSYLSGSLGSAFTRQTSRQLGFNFLRIDPSLIAEEAEPTARLTLGQDVTDKAGVVYSVNLKNSADQIWIGRLDLTKRFTSRVVRQSDNSYRFQFQHDLAFGGTPDPARSGPARSALRTGAVTIDGDSPIPETTLRKRFGLRTGKPYDFFAFRKGSERVKEELAKAGYLEAQLRADREPRGDTVDLRLHIAKGERVRFVYEGASVPRGVQRELRRAWSRSGFESLRARQTAALLREHFVKDGYYSAAAEPAVQPTPEGKRVLFEIDRGKRHGKFELSFPGASPSQTARLREAFATKRARLDAVLQPERARVLAADRLREAGLLDARVAPLRREESPDAKTLRLLFPVTEGPRFRAGEVAFRGSSPIDESDTRAIVGISNGDAYDPADVEEARTSLEEALRTRGYGSAEVTLAASVTPAQRVDLAFDVAAGDRRVLDAIGVEGNQHVSDRLIQTQIAIKPGEAINSAKLSEARRNLYATSAFNFADLELLDRAAAPGTIAAQLTARVREVRPFALRYGALYDTERGPGGIVDFSVRNILGSARVAGFRGRYDGDLREARAYFEQPTLLRFPMKWVSTGFARREVNETFLTDRTGGTTAVEFRWKRHYRLNAGYRFEQVHTFEREPDPIFPFDIRLRVAPVTAGFSRDTRDDLLDATRGSFSSHIAEWAPSTLGSQFRYVKYFGQYFRYFPLLGQRKFENAPPRPRLVFATGARFGIASGLGGQDLIPSERFFAGGGTSLRGFAQDTLGAVNLKSPEGGEALWILNNEARVSLFRYADAVGFLDAGNLYRRYADFSLADVRTTSGLGVRIRTPYVLIRVDYGLKLNRRPGERAGGWFIGIGQAF